MGQGRRAGLIHAFGHDAGRHSKRERGGRAALKLEREGGRPAGKREGKKEGPRRGLPSVYQTHAPVKLEGLKGLAGAAKRQKPSGGGGLLRAGQGFSAFISYFFAYLSHLFNHGIKLGNHFF